MFVLKFALTFSTRCNIPYLHVYLIQSKARHQALQDENRSGRHQCTCHIVMPHKTIRTPSPKVLFWLFEGRSLWVFLCFPFFFQKVVSRCFSNVVPWFFLVFPEFSSGFPRSATTFFSGRFAFSSGGTPWSPTTTPARRRPGSSGWCCTCGQAGE